jgi:hypothetical protein
MTAGEDGIDMMRPHVLCWLLLVAAVPAGAGNAPPTAAGAVDPAQLEANANLAFDRGQYSAALPLLRKLLETLPPGSDRTAALEEKVRVCQTALAAAPGMVPPQDPRPIATAPEERKRHVRPAQGQVLQLALRDLGNFDYDPEKGGLPEDVTGLSGVTLRTRGYMIPLDSVDNITEFALVPSLFACCFGQPPQVQHTLMVRTPKGKEVSFYPDEIMVEGRLTVRENKEEGVVISVFEMECTSVKVAPQE